MLYTPFENSTTRIAIVNRDSLKNTIHIISYELGQIPTHISINMYRKFIENSLLFEHKFVIFWYFGH